jgi:magnesium transporter
LVWLDLQSPVDEEIAGLVQRYNLHPLVGEELRRFPSLPKIQAYKDYMVVVLNIPVRTKQKGVYKIVDQEVDFVIGKTFLITSREETIEQLEYFSKIFEANAILNRGEKIEHAGHLFYYMVKRMYAGMFADLENIRDALLDAENHVFSGDERRMVEVLSGVSRELIDFRQAARIHQDVWEGMLKHTDKDFFNADFFEFIRDLRDQFNRIHELVVNSRELLADLRETNDSLLNTKQNDIIRTLTIINFVFVPATFIAALFTIPASFVPLVSHESGWVIILTGMVLMTGAIWFYIKRKGWI